MVWGCVSVFVNVHMRERKGERLRIVTFIGEGMRGWIWSDANKMCNVFIGHSYLCFCKHNGSNWIIYCSYQMFSPLFEKFFENWKFLFFQLVLPIKECFFFFPHQKNLEIVHKSNRKAVRSRMRDSAIPPDSSYIFTLWKDQFYSLESFFLTEGNNISPLSQRIDWFCIIWTDKIWFSAEEHEKSLVQCPCCTINIDANLLTAFEVKLKSLIINIIKLWNRLCIGWN